MADQNYAAGMLYVSYRNANSIIISSLILLNSIYYVHNITCNSCCIYVYVHTLAISFLCRSAVRVIRSERAGMGKSLYVSRLTRKLKEKLNQSNQPAEYSLCVTIPVHGPTVNYDEIMKSLQQNSLNFTNLECFPPQIFHFDIASSVRIT